MLTVPVAMGRTTTPNPMEAPSTVVKMVAPLIFLPQVLAKNKCSAVELLVAQYEVQNELMVIDDNIKFLPIVYMFTSLVKKPRAKDYPSILVNGDYRSFSLAPFSKPFSLHPSRCRVASPLYKMPRR